MLDFDIVDVKYALAVLDMRACLDLNIVKLIHVIQTQPETHTSIAEEFANVFKLGCFLVNVSSTSNLQPHQ